MQTPTLNNTTKEKPEISYSDPQDHERFSHYVRKSDHFKGYVLGQPIKALCGKYWTPSRDPEKFPVCPTCKELAAHI